MRATASERNSSFARRSRTSSSIVALGTCSPIAFWIAVRANSDTLRAPYLVQASCIIRNSTGERRTLTVLHLRFRSVTIASWEQTLAGGGASCSEIVEGAECLALASYRHFCPSY